MVNESTNEDKAIWNKYYQRVADKPAHETLLKAIALFEQEKSLKNLYALDLGCGAGRDTKALLVRNWSVMAIDGEEQGIKLLLQSIEDQYKSKVKTKVNKFEDLNLNEKFDLVNSSMALPFCRPESFPEFWSKLTSAIKVGGRFSGQLFGPLDGWSKNIDMNFHSKEEVKKLFENFEMEYFLEEETDHPSVSQEMKHWHIFHIVAKKI